MAGPGRDGRSCGPPRIGDGWPACRPATLKAGRRAAQFDPWRSVRLSHAFAPVHCQQLLAVPVPVAPRVPAWSRVSVRHSLSLAWLPVAVAVRV